MNSEEDLYRLALDALEQPLCLCDPSGRILFMNRSARGLLGAQSEGALIDVGVNPGSIETSSGTISYSFGPLTDEMLSGPLLVHLSAASPDQEQRSGDRILAGAALASNQFLITEDIDLALKQAIEILGYASDVDRVYIFENYLSVCGEPRCRLKCDWMREGLLRGDGPIPPVDLSYSEPFPWYDPLSKGMPLKGLARELPEPGRRLLAALGVKSYLIVPISTKDGFWGFIGFDDRRSERVWSWREVSVLMTIAGAIGGSMDRWVAQAALRETRDYLENLFGYANAPIIVWDPQLRITRFNHAFERLTGHQASTVLGKSLEILFPYESREASLACIDRTLSGEMWESVEIPILRKDGDVRTVLWNSATIYDELGRNAIATIAQGQDITERKEAEGQVLFQALLLDQVRNAIIATDLSGRIIYWNHFSELLYQWRAEEVLGRNISETVVPVESRGLIRGVMEEIIRYGYRESEHMVVRKDGSRFPALYVFSLLKDSQGQSIGFVGVSIDLTDRKRVERDLLCAKERAESATRAKSEFLANMSHEIRTPMNAVIGLTGLLLNTNIDPFQRDYIETIRCSGDALLSVISDILDFSKIEGGMLDLEQVPFDLVGCLEASLHMVSHSAEKKGLSLGFSIDPEVPRRIRGDLTRLKQILVNLLGNAVKFTERGGVSVHVSIIKDGNGAGAGHVDESISGIEEGSRDETIHGDMPVSMPEVADGRVQIRFSVRDTGIGIGKDRMSRLFQSFSQVDASTTRKYGGTGLGLVISKNLAELMGGRIWARSEPGRGSVFCFTIMAEAVAVPLASEACTSEQKRATKPPEKASVGVQKASSRPPRILLAEDNAVNQKVALKMLEKLGYRAEIAENGLLVLEAVSARRYDIVLMDVQMPEMDGLEATRRIRNMTIPQPYIIAMTAHAMKGDREICLESGMNDYVSKPVRIEELLAAIERSSPVQADDKLEER